MNKNIAEAYVDEEKKVITLFSKRLYLLLSYIDFSKTNLIEKTIICDFLNEIARDINIEVENLTHSLIS
jgi:hypothetical protein